MITKRYLWRAFRSVRCTSCSPLLLSHAEPLLRPDVGYIWLNHSNFSSYAAQRRPAARVMGRSIILMGLRSNAALVEAETAKKDVSKPVIDLPTSDENEELLKIRHSVSRPGTGDVTLFCSMVKLAAVARKSNLSMQTRRCCNHVSPPLVVTQC
jgi:hypothetical protein